MEITRARWGTHDGYHIYLFTLENKNGAKVQLTNFGAALVSVLVPDSAGKLANVVLGYPEFQGYLYDNAYMGVTVGRFANRIACGRFELNGKIYLLEDNDNGNSNHGGFSGFHKRVFDGEVSGERLLFRLHSPDGEGGYPGNLEVEVAYEWTDDNRLLIVYTAFSDCDTIAGFTNHAYFNLSGRREKILGHRLRISGGRVLEAGTDYIPTGRVLPAGGLSFNGGFLRPELNVCYVLSGTRGKVRPAAALWHEGSGRILEVSTTYPGMMLYTGDFLGGNPYEGHLGYCYSAVDGLCLECQYYPDSPNQPGFPSVLLRTDEHYRQEIIYHFKTM